MESRWVGGLANSELKSVILDCVPHLAQSVSRSF